MGTSTRHTTSRPHRNGVEKEHRSAREKRLRYEIRVKHAKRQAQLRRKWLNELDPFWSSWLAGFIDGEGCFEISQARYPTFKLGLRDDDYHILQEIIDVTGLGTLMKYKTNSGKTRKSNPAARWNVVALDDCLCLVALLEKYPLRAKKRKEFKVWAKVVRKRARSTLLYAQYGNQSWVKVYDQRLRTLTRYPTAPHTCP